MAIDFGGGLKSDEDLEIAFDLLSFLFRDEQEQHQFIEKYLDDVGTLLKIDFAFDLVKMQQASVYDILEYAIKQFDLAPSSDAYINFFMDTVLF